MTSRLGDDLNDLNRAVATSLQRRGLLSVTMERTAAGAQADRQLDTWLQLARTEIPYRADDFDLSWVRAYLHGAGAAVLLEDAAYPALSQIGRRHAPGHADPDPNARDGWLDLTLASLAELEVARGVFLAGTVVSYPSH